jgi:hypothetical protein
LINPRPKKKKKKEEEEEEEEGGETTRPRSSNHLTSSGEGEKPRKLTRVPSLPARNTSTSPIED